MSGKVIDEKGKRYGRLLVLGRAEKKYERGKNEACWWCQCECGDLTLVRGRLLRGGHTKSCGCLRGETNRLPRGVSAFNRVVRSMKRSAKRRGLTWHLTDAQVRHLTKQPCHYCGVEPAQVKDSGNDTGVYIYNGVDRIDSERGYTIDNVVSCCGTCNLAKQSKTVEQFRDWAISLYNHFASVSANTLAARQQEKSP